MFRVEPLCHQSSVEGGEQEVALWRVAHVRRKGEQTLAVRGLERGDEQAVVRGLGAVRQLRKCRPSGRNSGHR
jgi:hypothetical protein